MIQNPLACDAGLPFSGFALLIAQACIPACCVGFAWANPPTAAEATPTAPPPPPFRLFRYDEDYSYLQDQERRTGFLDPIKYIPLDERGEISLSFGGEARSRYEYSSAPAFGLRGPGHDDYFLQRFSLHTDVRFGKHEDLNGRAFVQIISGLVTGEDFPKPGSQDNALDVQQAFGEISVGDTRPTAAYSDETSFRLRAGRQEMGFGSLRLITVREPTNTRLSFDGARATLLTRYTTIDAFLVRPTENKIGRFNDTQDDKTTFWGVYSTTPLTTDRRLMLDLYYLGIDRKGTRFETGIGDELRHSVGSRLSGRYGGWDHDTEAVFQFGTFETGGGTQDITAWTVASNTGFTFNEFAWKPRIGIKLNIASGDDDPNDGRLETFNPLFPRNNYFSDANLLAPYNFFDIHPTITLRPSDSITIAAGLDMYFRYSKDDAVFSPAGIVIPAAASDSRFVGSTFTLVADWSINRHLALSASYAHFFRGSVVKDAGGKDVDYFGVWLSAKF